MHRIELLGIEARIELDALRVRDSAQESLRRGLEQGKAELRERLAAFDAQHEQTPDAVQLKRLQQRRAERHSEKQKEAEVLAKAEQELRRARLPFLEAV
jgi:hypothetical protein